MEFSGPEYWNGQSFPSPGDLPDPGIEPRSPRWQVNSLPAEPQGKPKNIGVGSLFFFQGIFPTQESNWGLLHCSQILYQLNELQGKPKAVIKTIPQKRKCKKAKGGGGLTNSWEKKRSKLSTYCNKVELPGNFISSQSVFKVWEEGLSVKPWTLPSMPVVVIPK